MSRRRNLSTDISVDPKLAHLAELHGSLPLLLYTWAIPHADDQGRITADPTQFRLTVCPALPVKSTDVDAALDQIAAAGLWERGERTIQFPAESWFRHQSYIPKDKRGADGDVAEPRRETPKNAEPRRETPKNASSLSPSLTESVGQNTPLPPDCAETAGRLSDLGLGQADVAEILAASTCEEVREQIDWLEEREKTYGKPVKYRRLLLKKACIEKWPITPEMREMRRTRVAPAPKGSGKARASPGQPAEQFTPQKTYADLQAARQAAAHGDTP